MPRPRKLDRPVRLEISLPESLHAKLSILLFSPAEGCIPKGAWSEFVTILGQQALDRLPKKEINNGSVR